MNIRWEELEARKNELITQLSTGKLDGREREKLQRELSTLTEVLGVRARILALEKQLEAVGQQLLEDLDPEFQGLFIEEQSSLQDQLKKAQSALDEALFPPDEIDDRAVYLEIRAGTGGQEASLFAADLLRMYSNYALSQGWSVSIVSVSQTDLKGYREVVAYIKGRGVYGALKRESGVHRVQRVPLTETSGRVHTSTVTVAVLPEIKDDTEVEIDSSDLRIDVFRASGAGGQHVNTTDSAVRITHLPTGVVVSCQDERSQFKNKAKALKVLKSRILAEQTRQREAALSEKRREMVGGAQRAEKVRTYNYPQNRITDHQINLTLNKLDIMMEGVIDELIKSLKAYDLEMRRTEAIAKFS